ncbi:hypothetical protein [Tessaracoccus coleopterorum]|uniref:hypothetical protein n=1 Tax=Tessaracoccus coleopterorum TaxID=2714950 RepID=UPI001E5858FE|nr:hypothetical protein [Tessaracoccus coleopterorum]
MPGWATSPFLAGATLAAAAALQLLTAPMASACSLVLDPDPPSIAEEIADAEIAALVRVVAEFEPRGRTTRVTRSSTPGCGRAIPYQGCG